MNPIFAETVDLEFSLNSVKSLIFCIKLQSLHKRHSIEYRNSKQTEIPFFLFLFSAIFCLVMIFFVFKSGKALFSLVCSSLLREFSAFGEKKIAFLLIHRTNKNKEMEMEMQYQQVGRTSLRESLKNLENDVQHANDLIAALPKAKGGGRLQMKLVYGHIAPVILFFLQWFNCSLACFLPRYVNIVHVLIYKVYNDGRPKMSTCGRKASIKDFYAVILPSLEQLLHDGVVEQDASHIVNRVESSRGRSEGDGEIVSEDSERDDECGICLEPCAKVVLPSCCHAMCINCFRDWSTRSESCPFCRGGLSRVASGDLWVLTSKDDVVDPETISSEDVHRFYQFLRSLPKDSPDATFLAYYEYLM